MSSLGVYSFLSSNCALLSTFLFILRVTFTTAQTYPGYPQRLGGYLNPVDLHPRIVYPNRTSLIREGPTVPDFGPWGPWTESSDCSRTCGGGIAYQNRICMDVRSDGQHTCVGTSRRYFTCNSNDCPPPLKDFRAEQCARFNSVPYKGSYYSWLPYYGAQNPCELNCLPHVGSFYAKLDKRVIDGTRCKDDGSRDMCVDGECMSVGCDNILGSTNREDECGVCGGDGSSCQIVKGLFEDDNFEVGYNDILLIPVGSTSILITEVSPTNNFLAIRNSLGVFYLNGNWRIDYPREIKVAGTIFHYERKQQGRLQPDTLRAKGPTVEPIYIVLLYQERNLGISYEYSIPATSKSRLPDSYSWTSGDFEECSQTCGGGVQYRPVRCVRNSDKDIVDEELCDLSAKPSVNASCNTEPCPSGWQIGEWSECSESCGGGTQFRLVFCHQSVGRAVGLIPDEQCEQPKPVFMRACNVDKECPDWLAGEWSECDRECGTGNQTRTVECRSGGSGGEVQEETLCSADQKPADNQPCNLGPCEGVEWIVSEWSGCDGSCSPHLQSRSVHCANEDGLVFPDDECEAAKKPELTKECPTSPMCEPMWHASQWSECSVNCGKGVQSRIVFCGVWQENETVMKIEDDKCEVDKKFESVQNCSAESCEGVWFTGPWNRCSVPCGGGERARKILCFHENEVVDADSCSASERPDDKETCNMTPCDEDEIMEIGGCKDSKYGCCPDGVTTAGPNDEGCPKMDIVSANTTCEEAEYGCCEDNFTLALGPFKKGCPITVSCNSSKHGCCPDLETPASGPDMEGCPEIESCFNSTFGCCRDNVTFANSFEMDGCEETPCENTTYGCCSDGLTAASGPNYEGCDNATTAFPAEIEGSGENCYDLKFGCCPDGMTPAEGVNQTGCEDAGNTTDCKTSAFGCCEDDITFAEGPFKMGCLESSGDGEFIVPCNESTFGCCPDNITLAKGFNDEGCFPEDCSNSFYGCCPDNVTSATGLNEEGCFPEDCTNSTFGCCPDNVTAAFGFDNEGCFPKDCSNSTFGCCPNNVTAALGFDNEGCFPEDCSNSTFGCCPDNVTAASGYDGEGCEVGNCSNYLFGCCPDNVTEAQGPDGEGCEPIDCSNTTFGCCPDNSTIAKGPDYQGCIYDDCSNTTYGCCSDNKTVSGPSFEGCDDTITLVDCGNTTFGCCPDNTTAASGPDFEGCENATDCSSTEFGCCPNNITVAVGMDFEGCNETETTTVVTEPLTTTVPPDCVGSTFGCCPDEVTEALGRNLEGCCFGMRFGCCPDNKTAALGPTFLGCGCQTYPYGCCPDGITPSQGFNYHGCKCEHFRYGCCQDKFTPATGPNFEGCVCQLMQYGCCPDGRTPRTSENDDDCGCESTRFGCCPDGRTPAQGADMSGCTCDSLPYGCCPNGFTPARTPDLRDCPCETQRYGCCLDGRTMVRGPNYEGCPCDSTRFGCCPDGRTVAQGPNMYDCPCETLPYGCCADGYTPARGQRYEGCPDVRQPKPEVSTEVCSFPKDSGPCRNFTVKWFFDIAYGGCSRFWYGGCDGNGNKFDTTEDCENMCVKPEGPEACFLPKTIGSCNDKIPSWYYDVGSESCEAFTYGGCLGNNNRFVSKEACEQKCINLQPTSVDKCDLPKDEGSCDGAVIQWYYNKQNTRCEQFYYGGCKGNANRFDTRRECESSCLANVVEERDVCRLPQNPGTCSEFRERWFFDYEMGQCHRFLYSGCDGNDNNFGSFGECEQRCGKKTDPQPPPPEMEFRTEYCFLTQDPGNCNTAEVNWYYDSSDGVCKEFYYGGCRGNQNRFKTRKECETSCFKAQDVCSLSMVKGACSGTFTQWYYDKDKEDCLEFVFTGCQGNANRFNSKESCYQRCRREKLVTTQAPVVSDDVCLLPQEPGPCVGYYPMFYYDPLDNNCKSFVYSGCEGNGNRFTKRAECEGQCIKKTVKVVTEPPRVFVVPQPDRTSNEDVCRLPVEPGPCKQAQPRWFYDAQTQSCLPFVFGGCGGNTNRFKTSEICLKFCTGIKATRNQDRAPASEVTTTTTAPSLDGCAPSNCADIQCPYGIEESFDINGCSSCRCSNPCEVHSCPDGSRCAIDVVRTSRESIRSEPVCRRIVKPGSCPSQLSASDCESRCRDDADCRGEHKCCSNGCAFHCVPPEDDYLVPATQPEPARILPGPNVTEGKIGEPAELPCNAIGWPKPTVTWWRETTMLPLASQRYEQLPNYALLIRSVVHEDAGGYSCHAHNGIGSGSIFKVTLIIDIQAPPYGVEDSDFSARDSEPAFQPLPPLQPFPNAPTLSTHISLATSSPTAGAPLQLDCNVTGPPTSEVSVTWRRGGEVLLEDERRRMLSNHTLLIAKAEVEDGGMYECVAQHGGSVASSAVAVEVKPAPEDASCIDNPQFSNCELIVQTRYCNNKFYGKYCCASCTKAGQLQSSPPQE